MNKEQNLPGKLIVVSAPSGCGKTTINKTLAARKVFELSVSCTTRAARDGEVHGEDYFFITPEEFTDMQARKEFLESAEVYGNFYGTPRPVVEKKLSQGINVLLELDVQGALAVKAQFPEALLIFIQPPNLTVLAERLHKRGLDTPEVIKKRLAAAEDEMSYCSPV